MFKAQYYVTMWVEAPVSGATMEEALAAAKNKRVKDLVTRKNSVELNDDQIQLSGVFDPDVNGGGVATYVPPTIDK